jgi:hypothetical protein
MCETDIIDTFPAFLSFWESARRESLDAQLDGWANTYLAPWPELLEKQKRDYSDEGYDWRQIAEERVIPFWAERLPLMTRAHENLLEVCTPVYKRARKALDFREELLFVVYVGIGCGAGWATTYQSKAAILLGLENIAEEGWEEADVLRGLVAHEIGHVWHFERRAQAGLAKRSGPWWDLYTEGVAQRCEHVTVGRDTWHMAAKHEDWLSWCRGEKQWLSNEFLRVVDAGGEARQFFGSWFDIRGYKQTGYFLGHEAVRQLEGEMALQQIALLEDVETAIRDVVESIARGC